MLARVLEAAGVSTTSISLVREHTEKVKPPRALWVPFPFGYALGRPDDPVLQHRVLRAALDLQAEPAGPVLRDFPDDAEPGDQPGAPPQASGIKLADAAPSDVAMEATQMRRYHEVWVEKNGGRTLLGLSGIPATRFRGVVRCLEEFGPESGRQFCGHPHRSAEGVAGRLRRPGWQALRECLAQLTPVDGSANASQDGQAQRPSQFAAGFGDP